MTQATGASLRVGFWMVATGPYIGWFDQLYQDVTDRFLPGCPVKEFFLFTDATDRTYPGNVHVYPVTRKGFPGDTLYRFHYLLEAKKDVQTLTDVLYYLDVDMRVVGEVGPEVLPSKDVPYVGVAHPGFWNNRTPGFPLGTPETRPESTAYIDPGKIRPCYWAGGFSGGLTREYLEMAAIIRRNVNKDDDLGLVAVWHDESHLNAYFSHLGDLVGTMPPDYCYPESWDLGPGVVKKIVALDKDHKTVRAM